MVVPMMCYRALVGSAVTDDVQQPAAEPAANQATTSTSPAAEDSPPRKLRSKNPKFARNL